MNVLLEENKIEGMVCGSNYAYILKDNAQFLSTEYKVLQSQAEGCFLKCMKTLYNGRIQLYYLTYNYKPFVSMIPNLDAESFMTIVSNLLKNILEVKNNGFLACKNIDISFEHIYVDPNTLKVALMYLPASIHFSPDDSYFENELRTNLVKLLSGITTLESPKTIQFVADLSNGMLGLEALVMRTKGGNGFLNSGENKEISRQGNNLGSRHMQLIAMNAPVQLVIDITKDEFIIGKKAGQVDRVISFNNMISRIHCKVGRQGTDYTITDLQSANGTFVNRVRLQPNRPYLVKHGDVIRMANSDFQVVIK